MRSGSPLRQVSHARVSSACPARAAVEALEARRLLHTGLDLSISFQPTDAPVDGFYVDTGSAFSFRADSGHRYGWTMNGTAWRNSWTSRRETDADDATDSFIALGHRSGLTWEISVPNGGYRVTLAAGDPLYREGESHRLAVEGTVALDHTATAANPTATDTVDVDVTDGRLSVSAPDGLANSKMAWIRIVAIDDGDDGSGGGGGGGGGTQTPWGSQPVVVPSRIEAEWFDRGGQDVAFNDSDPDTNQGGEFRDDGPDILLSGGETVVGWTRSGEWLEYTIKSDVDAKYHLSVRAATGNDGGRIEFSIDGERVGSTVTLTDDGWTLFRVYDGGTFELEAGTHVLRMAFVAGGAVDVADVDWIEIAEHEDDTTVTLGGWESLPSMPHRSFEGASARIDSTIYIWGGYDTPNVWRSRTRGQAFDTASGTWSLVADLPQALTHMQAVPYGGKIYIFGGYVNTDTASGARDDVWVYDPASDSFSHLLDMPVAIAGHGVALLGSRAYVVSGMFRQGRNFLAGSKRMFSIDLENAGAGWRNEPDTPVSRDHFNTVTIDGRIYIVSGSLDDNEYTGNRPDVYRFDPADGTWTRVADIPEARGHIDQSTIAWNGRIFVVGGSENGSPGNNYATEVFMYDAADDHWTLLGNLPAPRRGAAVAIIGDYLYVMGGGDGVPQEEVWRARVTIS